MIYKRRDLIPMNCRKNIYFALIHSRVQYGVEIYLNAAWKTLRSLYVACNRSLRLLQGLNRFSNVKLLYCQYNTLPIHLLYKVYLCRLIYKSAIQGEMSAVTRALFEPYLNNHAYNTRLSETPYLYTECNKAFFRTCVYDACLIWNDIPTEIRNSVTLHTFTNAFKSFLLDDWQS